MSQTKIVFLMYHELELPERTLLHSDAGYTRYVLRESTFREHLEWLKQHNWLGLCVSDALKFPSQPAVAITFDDGCETDSLAAAPLLREWGFGATFYVTSGFIGRKDYLSPTQVRELSNAGFEIGCHSRTHAYLTDLSQGDLLKEVALAKTELEQIVGKRVEHFSCPGGRYDARVAQAARDGGYLTVATSRFQANTATTDRFGLGRIAMLRSTSVEDFENVCRARRLSLTRAADQVRGAARHLLGNNLYDQLRGKLLGSQ
jgi:peptidoglycan/xylan/chitin deacetylase (PgdA/CDA1 family)